MLKFWQVKLNWHYFIVHVCTSGTRTRMCVYVWKVFSFSFSDTFCYCCCFCTQSKREKKYISLICFDLNRWNDYFVQQNYFPELFLTIFHWFPRFLNVSRVPRCIVNQQHTFSRENCEKTKTHWIVPYTLFRWFYMYTVSIHRHTRTHRKKSQTFI